MNREGAETYLRLLAEAEMRDPSRPLTPALSWSSGLPPGTTCRKLQVVAQALTALDALPPPAADAILADFDLAVSARQPRRERSAGQRWPAAGISRPAMHAAAIRVRARSAYASASTVIAHSRPPAAASGQAAPGAKGPGAKRPGADAPERFLPLGLTIPFEHEVMSGALYLMSYAHTAAGGRLTVAWRAHDSFGSGPPLVELCEVTDDRGGRYQLNFTGTCNGAEWTGVLMLRPDPPRNLRWLDIRPRDGTAVRVALDDAGTGGAAETGGAAADVRDAALDPGGHLLTLAAERLLTAAQLIAHDLWRDLPATSPGPLSHMATGLGEVVAALEAAELLSPASPLPGRLATLCANLRISVPELTAAPARDLPETWLSALAHLHRRKPDAPPHRDGTAALAAALPEIDGIRLVFLGLNNAERSTFLHVLTSGLTEESRHGPFGIDLYFPLSVWVRDSGGRWHLGRPDGRYRSEGEDMIQLRLTPPLPRSAVWIEVLAAGRSAQVRARLPLRWENRP